LLCFVRKYTRIVLNKRGDITGNTALSVGLPYRSHCFCFGQSAEERDSERASDAGASRSA